MLLDVLNCSHFPASSTFPLHLHSLSCCNHTLLCGSGLQAQSTSNHHFHVNYTVYSKVQAPAPHQKAECPNQTLRKDGSEIYHPGVSDILISIGSTRNLFGHSSYSFCLTIYCFVQFNNLNVCVSAESFSRAWLCDPMDCSPPGSSVHGIFQARMMEWVDIPSSRESSWTQGSGRRIGRWILYPWATYSLTTHTLTPFSTIPCTQ